MSGIRLQPLARQQLCTTGFAAFLPAQNQLVRGMTKETVLAGLMVMD
jgi:hypothetical protein